MPLTTRSVSPVDLSIHRLPASVQQDELQCVANGTLANLIRQLSSISRHAEQTFSEIHREVLKIDHRTNTLFLRVERLSQKVSQQSQSNNNLRGVADQASLEDAALRKAFKSCNIIDQHSLSRQTLPNSLQEQYQRCDAPPQLNQLNPYREDEKAALRYYTDPGYFFELWRQEILKGCNVEKKRTGRSPTSPSRQRRRQKEQQQHQHLSQQQQDVLLSYHASSRSSDYTRFVAPQNQPGTSRHQQQRVHHQQQQRVGGMLPNSAAEMMHFPAEYQAPQALLASRGFMQPPPGMSVVGGGGELTSTTQGQQNYNQQPVFRQNIMAPSNEQHLPQQQFNMQQGQNIAFHQMDAQMGQMEVAPTGAMAFLDDDDDELPPPPPQTILGSAAFAQHSSPAASSDSPSLPFAGDGVQLPEANNNHTIQNVPPPPQQQPTAGVQLRQKIPPAVSAIPAPPPPPPPPPPVNFAKKINATTTDGNKTFAGEEEGQNVQRKPSTTSNGTQGNRSQLLVQIQEGVKLKKVKQEEELAEKRAVETSNDVAAILRKRMEHCLGESDSSSAGGSPTADDNEWDD